MSSIRDFVPLNKLGQGTFSTVYKVRRLSDQKIYAIKKVKMSNLSQKQKQNALNEIRILASFDCNNIVAYKEAFFDDKLNVLCIVMQYADGGDLHHFIEATKKDFRAIPEITIWKCAADILVALDHLHSKGILHRDLKSANIFIHGDEYKLGDLNVSKVNGGRLAYTQTGTPYYASPQVWRDEPYDSKSDIWSFGCILYELACLKPPFQGQDMDELFRNVQKSSYIPIPQEYSLELADLIDMCLQKNAKYRPRASQLLEHDIISRFKNRKNNPIDQKMTQQQLLRTIKLPNDLRSLKMNLPTPKYDTKSPPPKPLPLRQGPPETTSPYSDPRRFISDREGHSNKSQILLPKKQGQIYKNQSHVVNNMHILRSPRGNKSQVISYLSPRSVKKVHENYSSRSPQPTMQRVISANISSPNVPKPSPGSEKRPPMSQNSSDRQITHNSQRRITSLKKNLASEKYEAFIRQELDRKSQGMPRTEKRVLSGQGVSPLAECEKKDLQQWRKKLVKKSRVFSGNVFLNKPVYNSNKEIR